ncbi:mitochondrial ATP synthase epsilon chain-domain-containing protein [Auriculariales sp. MPI-PUGE-AT-0066]|nr:mitochondrial ATP synthase epsilon chain-domain-containing protein [Auriculariales sp. MPI-PUGE-AT-0066]
MSSNVLWRSNFSYNKFTTIAARALRSSLKEAERVKAEKRGNTTVRFQKWADGKGGEQVHVNPPTDKH